MKVYGDVERVDLATGERFRRVSGDGESRLVSCCDHTRLGPGIDREREMEKNAADSVAKLVKDLQRRNAMSWSTGFKEPVRKVDADAAVDRLHTGTQVEGPAIEQCEAAKRAAKELLKSIPGPYVQVSLSGHANGVGWQKKDGWANDCITVNITQMTEADLPKTT